MSQNAGLRFTADGGKEFLSTIQAIERAGAKLDAVLKKIAATSKTLESNIKTSTTSFNASGKAIDHIVSRIGKLDKALADAAKQIPGISDAIKKGFGGSDLARFFDAQGAVIANAFIDGMERELGIASPSRVMMRIGQDIGRGLSAGLEAINLALYGANLARNFVTSFGSAIVGGIRSTAGQVRQAVEDVMRGAESALRSAGERFQSQGQSMMSGGMRTIMAGGVAALVNSAAFAIPVNSAVQFEQTMTNTRALLGQTAEEMAGLNAQVLAIGAASVAGPQQAAVAFYDIVSGVQDASTHLDILNSAIATSEAGQSSLTSTTSGLIAVMNSYGSSVITAAQASDVYSRTVGMGVGTMDQFVSAMAPISGLAATLDIGFDELGSSMAYLTAQGSTASASATRLQATMVAMLKPNNEMAVALRAAGYESGELAINQLGLVGALDAVAQAMDNDTGRMAAALGSTEALQAAVVLLRDGYAEFNESYMEGLDGATDRAREIQLQGVYAQVGLLKAAADGLAITIGTALLPPISNLLQIITPLINGIREWIQANPELAGGIIKAAAAVGFIVAGLTTLGGIIAVVSGAISFGLGGALLGMANGLGLITTLLFNPFGIIAGLGSVAATILSLVPVIGIFVAGFAGIAMIFSDIQNNVGGAGDAFASLMQTMGGFFGAIGGLVSDFSLLFGFFRQAGPEIERSFSPVTAVLQGIDNFVTSLTAKINTLRDFVRFAGGLQSVGNQTATEERMTELQQKRADLLERIAGYEALASGSTEDSSKHLIEQGDTLSGIAAKYGMSVDQLKELNNLQDDLIIAGQSLNLGGFQTGNLVDTFAGAMAGRLRGELGIIEREMSGIATDNLFANDLNVRPELDRIREGVVLVQQAIGELFSGEWETGFETLRTGFSQVADGVRGLWDVFSGPQAATVGDSVLAGFGEMGITVDTDTNPFIAFIEEQVRTLRTHDFSTLEQGIADNLDTIVRGAVTVFGIAAGGPVGAAIGIASIIATMIENDVAGLGTFINESGIRASVEGVFQQIQAIISDVFSGSAGAPSGDVGGALLAGFGEMGMEVDTGFIAGSSSPIIAAINDIVRGIQTAVEMFSPDIQESLEQIGSGLSGFFDNLSTADTTGLDVLAGTLLRVGGAIAGMFSLIALTGVDMISNIVENVLPQVGTAISGLITAISGLGSGDISQIGQGISDFLSGIVGAVAGFSVGVADGVISFIERLTGLELASVGEGVSALVEGLGGAWILLQIAVDNIRRSLSEFFLNIKLDILEGIAEIIEPVRPALEAAGINLMPELEFQIADVQRTLQDFRIDEQLRQAFAAGDFLAPIEFVVGFDATGAEVTSTISVMEMLVQSGFVDTLSTETRLAAENAVKAGLQEQGLNIAGVNMLITGAENLGISFAGMDLTAALNTMLDTAMAEGTTADFTTQVQAMIANGLDVDLIKESIGTQISTALAGGDTETALDLANLGIAFDLSLDDLFAEAPIDLGTQAGQALADGLAEMNEAMETAGLAGGESAKNGLFSALGIESPATVGIDAGTAIADGIVLGMAGAGAAFMLAVLPINIALASMTVAGAGAASAMTGFAGQIKSALSGVRAEAETVISRINYLRAAMLGLGFTQVKDIPYVGPGAILPGSPPPQMALGGPVSRGHLYEIDEQGATETAVIGNRVYLIPGQDGYVSPSESYNPNEITGATGSNRTSINNTNIGDMQIIVPEQVGTPEEMRDAVFDAIDAYNRQQTPDEVLRDIT